MSYLEVEKAPEKAIVGQVAFTVAYLHLVCDKYKNKTR